MHAPKEQWFAMRGIDHEVCDVRVPGARVLCRNGAGRLLGIPSSGSFEFGESKLVLEIDGTKSQHYPPHTLSVYVGDELLAKYKNVGFDKVYASKDNKFFVGVSNGGIPGTAFVVFDAEGNLLREEKHRFLPRALYTSQSVTVIRVWYDRENPNVEFDVRDGRLLAVFIRGSNNQRYNLLERDLGFREVPAER